MSLFPAAFPGERSWSPFFTTASCLPWLGHAQRFTLLVRGQPEGQYFEPPTSFTIRLRNTYRLSTRANRNGPVRRRVNQNSRSNRFCRCLRKRTITIRLSLPHPTSS